MIELHVSNRICRREYGSGWLGALPAKEVIAVMQGRLGQISAACLAYKEALDSRSAYDTRITRCGHRQ